MAAAAALKLRISHAEKTPWKEMISRVLGALESHKYLSVPGILGAIRTHWPDMSDERFARGAPRVLALLKANAATKGAGGGNGPFQRRRASWNLTVKERQRRRKHKVSKRKARKPRKVAAPPVPPLSVVPAAVAVVPPPPPVVVAVAAPVAEVPMLNPGLQGVTWQYFDAGKGGWCDYDVLASAEVEAHYQEYVKTPGYWDVRSVKSGVFNYMVDFPHMRQKNIMHQDHRVREIRRIVK